VQKTQQGAASERQPGVSVSSKGSVFRTVQETMWEGVLVGPDATCATSATCRRVVSRGAWVTLSPKRSQRRGVHGVVPLAISLTSHSPAFQFLGETETGDQG
jgi:hypothetical protein